MQEELDRLRALAARHVVDRRTQTPIPWLALNWSTETTQPQTGMLEPTMCLVLQGAKEVTIGDRVLRYDPASYFLAALDVPVSGCVIEASRTRPYASLSIRINRDTLASLVADADGAADEVSAAFDVSPVTGPLVQSCLRLVELLDTPEDIAVLAPLLEREILYRLLQGPRGAVLQQIVLSDSRLARVRRAVSWIRDNFDQTLRVEDLAGMTGMSAASFHRHFKAATAMSPLQFQKTLRLQHARRLLVSNQEVARVGYAVGYESASQFSREYSRLFGIAPARDAVRLRHAAPLSDVGA